METQELPPATTPLPEIWEKNTQSAVMVYDAILGVSLELSHEGISKERSNQQQGYKFRGIDDCLNALSSLLPKYGLIITPSVESRDCVERQTKSGGSLFYVTVRVRFSFISTLDGSRHDAVLYGEAMDSADKATNKAMSAAYKYCVLLTFCIPTEAEDADSVTHDVLPQAAPRTYEQKFPAPIPSKPAPVTPTPSTVPPQGWIVPFGKNKGRAVNDLADSDVDYLLKHYLGKLSDPANASSRFREEWETAVMEIRAELLARYPEPTYAEEGA